METINDDVIKTCRRELNIVLSRLQGLEGQFKTLKDDRDHWRGEAMRLREQILWSERGKKNG